MTSGTTLSIHPVVDLFPPMADAEFNDLVEDIRQNGLLQPICLHPDGRILDGRHRYRACEILGLAPRSVTWDGEGTAEAFVISMNLHRRHLTSDQVSMIKARFLLPAARDEARRNQDEARKAQAVRGKEGGRGKKKTHPGKVAGKGSFDDCSIAKIAAFGRRTGQKALLECERIAKEDPELADKIQSGAVPLKQAVKERKIAAREQRMASRAAAAKKVEGERCRLLVGDLIEVGAKIPDDSVDHIICDPPYEEAAVPLYEKLTRLASRVLKPGGNLVVMTGQSHLSRILWELGSHPLDVHYVWTLAFVTPGASTQVFGRKVKSNWKPVVWLSKGKSTWESVADVVTGENEGDKRFHEWGQTVAGFSALIERFSVEGEVILDPFLGGGTTAVAALATKRRFVGIDVDPQCVEATRERVESFLRDDDQPVQLEPDEGHDAGASAPPASPSHSISDASF